MNKQNKGNGNRGIEWTDYTWNPVKGCQHGCRWTMPDGTTAICYAEAVANGVAQGAYKQGFEHHYWEPRILQEPLKVKEPSRIFIDSMSDLMGHWVTDEQIGSVLGICKQAHWHTFQLLTKNAPRLKQFNFPPNVWVGASVPPTQMFGKTMTPHMQIAMLRTTLKILKGLDVPVRWMSVEPLSWDMAWIFQDVKPNLDWAVIGAASNGHKTYQPEALWVMDMLLTLDEQHTPVFFKGNLKPTWDEWREEFPAVHSVEQLSLL